MRAAELQEMLTDRFRANSLHRLDRRYLGMSGVGLCVRDWYWSAVDPRPADILTWFAWTGYMHEAAILKFLGGGKFHEMELVAPWDERFQGHIDHQLDDGTLVEIKSVSWKRFVKMQERKKPRWKDRAQAQTYMRYGGFPHAILVYVPRDIPPWAWGEGRQLPFWCVGVKKSERWADELDAKARRVLACMDRGEPPVCECGRCKR